MGLVEKRYDFGALAKSEFAERRGKDIASTG